MDAAHVSENTLWKKVKFITQISRKRFRFVRNQYFFQDKHYETKTVFFKTCVYKLKLIINPF